MKEFIALLIARNKEYYRDKGSLAWAFVFPALVIIGCALAFSRPDVSIFTVGIYTQSADKKPLPALQQPYIKQVPVNHLSKAQSRLTHHQLDLLVYPDQSRYWVNTQSSSGLAIEKLFLTDHSHYTRGELSGRKIRYVDWVIPGVLSMNLMFASLFGVGYVVVRYRRNGVLKRLNATPVTPFQFLSAQLVSRLLIVTVVNMIIFSGFLDVIILGNVFHLLLITLAGALAMIAIGLLVACRTANEELASGLLNVATWPMLLLSEVWFSLDDAPEWMQSLSDLLPLSHIVKAFREVMIEGASLTDVSDHLLAITALAAIALFIAARFFKWSD